MSESQTKKLSGASIETNGLSDLTVITQKVQARGRTGSKVQYVDMRFVDRMYYEISGLPPANALFLQSQSFMAKRARLASVCKYTGRGNRKQSTARVQAYVAAYAEKTPRCTKF